MSYFDWFLIVWWLFQSVLFITLVGKAREPISPLTAAINLVITLGLVAGLLWSRGVL